MKNRAIIVLADVDENLVRTSGAAVAATEEGTEPVAWDSRGKVQACLTPKQRMMLDFLRQGAEVVPTTARSTEALKGFTLPMKRYAITAFGGTILGANGKPLKTWQKHIKPLADMDKDHLANLLAVVKDAAASAGYSIRARILNDCGNDLFLSVKHNTRNLDELAEIHKVVIATVPSDWTVHLNGNFLAAYAAWLGKEKAVRWFIDNVVPKGTVTVGMGDSSTDLPFMKECDYSLMPNNTQNARALFSLIGTHEGARRVW